MPSQIQWNFHPGCEFTLEALGYEFPKYPVPEGETMMSFLRERTREGFQQRYGRGDPTSKAVPRVRLSASWR